MKSQFLFLYLKADNPHYLEERECEVRERWCGIVRFMCTHAHTEARATGGGFILEAGYLIS